MKTLYLRNVPDEVVERLQRLAGEESMSVTAFAVRELAQLSRRAGNADLLAALPDLRAPAASIVAALDAERARR